MKKTFAVISGIAGPLWVAGLTAIGGAFFPHYSHTAQYISELGSRDAPNGGLVSWAGFLPAGILICSFTWLGWRSLPKSVAATVGMIGLFFFGFGYLVAAFFPCEGDCRSPHPGISQAIHNLFGLGGYLFAPLSLWVLGWAAGSWPRGGGLRVLGFAAGFTALLGLLFLSPEFRYVGLAQRVLEGSVLVWITACALYLRR